MPTLKSDPDSKVPSSVSQEPWYLAPVGWLILVLGPLFSAYVLMQGIDMMRPRSGANPGESAVGVALFLGSFPLAAGAVATACVLFALDRILGRKGKD